MVKTPGRLLLKTGGHLTPRNDNQFEIRANARRAWITADGLNVMAYDPDASVLRVYDVFSGAVVAEQSLQVRYTSPTSPGLWWSANGWLAAFQVGDKP